MRIAEPASAKLNLALHVRGKMLDGRHRVETLFAFCVDGDRVEAKEADALSLQLKGPFADALEDDNLVVHAACALRKASRCDRGAALTLTKNLPIAAGIGGGSADAAATLRLLTRLWGIDPAHATAVAPSLGSDIPACLLSMSARGDGAGDVLTLVDDDRISGSSVLLVNPRVTLSTGTAFGAWDGVDRGPLGDWRTGRNDLESAARSLVPAIGDVLEWLADRPGAAFVRMSGSGATCFALFDSEGARDAAAAACPASWWNLATVLR